MNASGRRGSTVVIAVVSTLLVALAFIVAPRPLALPERTTGDAELAAAVRQALGSRPGTRAIAVARISPDRTRFAGLGRSGDRDDANVHADSRFEIGSVTKVLTGMVLADLVAEGTVALDTTVADVAELGALRQTPVGSVTLEQLAQHRSGLPRLAMGGPVEIARLVIFPLSGGNPYEGWSSREVLIAAAAAELDEAEFDYSNLGFGLLGHLLSAARGMSYGELLCRRILEPLDMTSTTVVSEKAALPRPRVRGTGSTGRHRASWIGAGYAPAGVGVWSSARDMARLLRATMEGTAPGVDAARPRVRASEDQRIGLGWLTENVDGREITWHNGGTGGFASWVGFDRDLSRGVVVLSGSDRPVGRLGRHLLGVVPPPSEAEHSALDLHGWLFLLLLVAAALWAWGLARRAWAGELSDWLQLAGVGLDSLAIVVMGWALTPLLGIPWWSWSLAAALYGVGVVVAVAGGGRELPLVAAERSKGNVVLGVARVTAWSALVLLVVG